MANLKTQNTSDAQAGEAPSPPSPEEEIQQRISVLQETLKTKTSELKIMEGRFANANPAMAKHIQVENQALKLRLVALEKALFALMVDRSKPRQAEDLKTQVETLRQAAVDFCKKANINPDIWKNIVS